MGDMANHDIEQGMDIYLDHLAVHPNCPDQCPYCEEEDGLLGEEIIESRHSDCGDRDDE